MSQVVVVVPCFNEAERLDPDAFVGALDDRPWMRLLFVDDGSTDATRQVLDALAEQSERIEVFGLEQNSGKAEAVRRGMLRALDSGIEMAAYWDADLATPFAELDPMRAKMLERGAALVMGSRIRLLGRRIERDDRRHYLGRVFATAAALVVGVPVYDTQCGAKLFANIPAVRSAFDRPFQSRWIFDVELLARLSDGVDDPTSIVEYPLRRWEDVPGSKVRPRDFVRAALDLATIAGRRRG